MGLKIDFDTERGVLFSACGGYRFVLWRNWASSLPKLLVIGLNPSTADAVKDDATTKKVIALAKKNGFGGVFLMNCFPFVATDPKQLNDCGYLEENDRWLQLVKRKVARCLFAWGNFKIVTEMERDLKMERMFPEAHVIAFNKNGSPKHPLYAPMVNISERYRKKLSTPKTNSPC